MKLSEYKKYGLIPLREEKNNYRKIHIFINGFLSENINNSSCDWFNNMKHLIDSDDNIYLFNWESGLDYFNIKNIGFNKTSRKIIPFFLSKVNLIISPLVIVGDIILDWKNSNIKSKKYGMILKKELYKFDINKINIYAHSLGAKLVKNTLLELSNHEDIKIDNLYLFGGATNSEDIARWKYVKKAVRGSIYNFYSNNDEILKKLYRIVEIGHNPVGLNKLDIHNCKNIDVSYTVNGHFEYKNNLATIFRNV